MDLPSAGVASARARHHYVHVHTSPTRIVFGPLRSRRLGRSLGINNIPPKRCTYSCIYCQAGTTRRRETTRRAFISVDAIVEATRARIERCRQTGDRIDYLTIVPSGEPTLDANLGAEVRAVRELGTPVAVITNASLLTRADVRADLMAADVVSVKVDSIRSPVWKRINRPTSRLHLGAIREGILEFARGYKGRLLTETMIVAGINDDVDSMMGLARYLGRVDPDVAYLNAPTRAPATRVEQPADRVMARLFASLSGHVRSAGLLLPDYPLMLSGSGDPYRDLTATVAVHPLCEESVAKFLEEWKSDWTIVEDLVGRGELRRQTYGAKVFFVRGHS
jgi:wyosine [tRNA(Phe)-imidazoG37] synthetase (radical SAM superfamily)